MNFTFEFNNDIQFGFENTVSQPDNAPKLHGIAAVSASGSTGITGKLVEIPADIKEE